MKELKPPKMTKTRNRLSGRGSPLDTASDLAVKRLKGSQENFEPYNEMAGDIAGQLSEGLRGPKNDIGSVASGLFQGIQNVTKFNKMFENDKKYQEYLKVMDYFQEVNNQKLQQQQYHDRLENAQEQLRPMALAYFGNTKKDPQTAFISGQQMWNKYKELTGETGDFLGWTPIDQNIAMIQNDGEVELLDIRPLLLGDQYTENEIARLGQDYQNKLQEERQRYDQEFALEDRKIRSGEELNRKRMDVLDAQINKFGRKEGDTLEEFDEEVPLNSFDAVTRRGFVTDARNEITASKEAQGALRILDELEKLSEEIPNISSLWTRNAPFGALSAEDQAAIKKYEKYQSQIAQPLIRARGSNITDTERNIILSGIPNWNQPLEARRDNIRTKKRELETLIARGIYAGNALSRKVIPSQLGYEKFLSSRPNLVPEGVNPTFVQSSDFRGNVENIPTSLQETSNTQDENLGNVSTDDLLRIYNNE